MAQLALRRRLLDLPNAGDVQQGVGISTAQRSNVNAVNAALSTGAAPGQVVGDQSAHQAPWLQPVPVWIAAFVLLVAAKYGAEKAGEREEFRSIRLGFWNIFVITAVAILGINAAKWVFGYWTIPGVSQLALAA